MQNEISYTYSSELVKQITKQLWWKHYGLGYLFYLSLPSLLLMLCLASGEFGFKGFGGFIIGFLSGVIGIIIFWFAYSYLNIEKLVAQSAKKWRNAVLTYKLSDDGIESNTGLSRSFYAWEVFEKTQRFPLAFLLFVNEYDPIVLPSQVVDEETFQFIESKIREARQNRS